MHLCQNDVKFDSEKYFCLARHAQGFHNVAGEEDYEAYKKEEFEDAFITPVGESQCNDLHAKCVENGAVKCADLLVVSPMRRTLATATKCFPDFMGKIPWLANEDLREQAGYHPCDRRRPISEHRVSYPHVDFCLTTDNEDPLYFAQVGRETAEHVSKRQNSFLHWLESRPEREILIVTHSAYLHNLFDNLLEVDIAQEEGKLGVFKNCEMKSYCLTFPKKEG